MSEEKENAEAPAAAAAPTASKSSKLVPLLLVVNLAATGAGIFFQLKHKPEGAVAAAAAEEKPKPEEKGGPTATLEPFVVNLNEAGSSRYLKATFEIEVKDAKSLELLEKDKRGVRDEILRYLSGLGVADTLGADNKDKIRIELVARVDKELGGGKVSKVFFNEFVVQ
jgi:flagellar FliL protein